MNKPQFMTLEKALAEYQEKGEVKQTLCEECGNPVEIGRVSEGVLSVKCRCGLYNDKLKGL